LATPDLFVAALFLGHGWPIIEELPGFLLGLKLTLVVF